MRHHNDASQTLITSADRIATALADLQDKLLQAEAATSVKDDPKGQLLKKWLSDPVLGWNSQIVDKLIDLLSTQDDAQYQTRIDSNHEFLVNLRIQYLDKGLATDLSALPAGLVIPDSIPNSFASQCAYDAASRRLVLVGYMSATDQATLKALPSADAAFKDAVDRLFNAQRTNSAAGNVVFADVAAINASLRVLLSNQLADRYKLLLAAISPVYSRLQQRDQVEKALCSWFKINHDVATAILTSRPSIYVDLTTAAFVHKANALTSGSYSALFDWYQRIAKISFITAKLKLTADDLGWFLEHAIDIGALELWNLPIVPINTAVTTFEDFEVLINVLKLEQRYPEVQRVTSTATTKVSIYSVFENVIGGVAIPVFESELVRLTRWDPTQLDELINTPKNYLNVTSIADFKNVQLLLQLDRCFATMKRLGVTAADCVAWSKPSLTWNDSAKIKQSLKAQNEGSQWLAIRPPALSKPPTRCSSSCSGAS